MSKEAASTVAFDSIDDPQGIMDRYPPYNQVGPNQPPAYMAELQPAASGPAPYGSPSPVVQQQPQPASTNAMVIINTGAQIQTSYGPRDWYHGLCGCCGNVGTCLAAYFCYSCLLCHLSSQMGESCCLPCCVPNALMGLRIKLRMQNEIVGTIQSDCCVTTCCPMCALAQMKQEFDTVREIRMR